jgi:ferredoxin-NADP reductase
MLRVIPSVWNPLAGANGFVRIGEAFARLLEQGLERPDVYVCGPQELLDSVRSVAAAHRVPASQIFVEQIL